MTPALCVQITSPLPFYKKRCSAIEVGKTYVCKQGTFKGKKIRIVHKDKYLYYARVIDGEFIGIPIHIAEEYVEEKEVHENENLH